MCLESTRKEIDGVLWATMSRCGLGACAWARTWNIETMRGAVWKPGWLQNKELSILLGDKLGSPAVSNKGGVSHKSDALVPKGTDSAKRLLDRSSSRVLKRSALVPRLWI
jgi:hypothetical protein